MSEPLTYAFADRKDGSGRYPVTDGSGALLARIRTSFWTTRFTVTDANEQPLCQGSKQALGPWLATDPLGAELLRVAGFSLTNNVPVHCRLGELTLRGRAFSRDWSVSDADGRAVLSSTPDGGWFSTAPDTWQVNSDGRLDLAETVALVQLHRLAVKRRRGAAASS